MTTKSREVKVSESNLVKCLTACEKKEEVTVVRVEAGQSAKMRLANLGLVPGTKITKEKSAPFHGPLEIIVEGTKLVIGRGLAEKIVVQCSSSCPTN